jgi:caspase domain-containing protein
MSRKYALIIANTEYIDSGLAQLTAPGKDAEDFAHILKDKDICAFDDVKVLLNQLSSSVIEAVDEFFDQKNPEDLLVLYFSGHGVRDELGALYLAVKNTIRTRLRSTAIKSDYIREVMDQSRSKRQVLIMDCCNSGAFAQGTKAATGVSIGTASAFEAGYGRIILTASDSTQFAWEGDKVIGNTDKSLFTHFLVEGLAGEADLDGDGRITVDELYDYAYEKVKLATPKQTPSKFSSKQQGEVILRQNISFEKIRPLPLPAELIDEMEDTRPYVREAAVRKLEKILKGKNIGLARSAKEALEKIAKDKNTTRYVSQVARQVLKSFRQTELAAKENRTLGEETEGLVSEKTTEEVQQGSPAQTVEEESDKHSKIEVGPSHIKGKIESEKKKSYRNQANSDHPATLIYLVDISGSMNAIMQDGKTRIEISKNAIQVAYAQMIQRSMRQGKIHPRYRVGMIAYSDEIYDVYGELGSIISIDKIKDEGIPSITPQKSTNMARAFRYAAKLIRDDIQKWPLKWLEECPPPMVINITDCEYDEKDSQDPLEFAQNLQAISVPDGNILVENIFITDQISVPVSAQDWQGYHFNDATGDLYGDKLLAMSSPIPSTYAQILREQAGFKIREGAAMMFPGITREFIKFGFVMSIVTGSQILQSSRPRTV